MKKNNRIFEKEKNISANRDGHFYDDYLGKNTFRKEVVLGFSLNWGKGGLHFSEAPLPHSPWTQSLETISSYWWVQRAGQRSWAGWCSYWHWGTQEQDFREQVTTCSSVQFGVATWKGGGTKTLAELVLRHQMKPCWQMLQPVSFFFQLAISLYHDLTYYLPKKLSLFSNKVTGS